MLSDKQLYYALEYYRHTVPFEGTITRNKAEELLAKNKICRGWILEGNDLEFFHIIKSPSNYPELAIFVSEDEEQLFMATIMLGMQSNFDLNDLFAE